MSEAAKELALPETQAENMLAVIQRAAADPSVDMDKLERLLQMQERLDANEAIRAFNLDFIALQNDLPEINEGGEIKHGGRVISKYSRWDEDINPVIKPILAKHNFVLSFETNTVDRIHVVAHLIHSGGHSRSGSFTLPPEMSGAKNDVQGFGSSVSYAKRYAAGPLLNLTTRGVDDDAVAAVASGTITEEQAIKIRERLEAIGRDESKFCNYLKVSSLDLMPLNAYGRAIMALDQAERTHANS